MFNSQTVVAAFANLLGWKQHYDTGEINLPSSLTDTETGEYYQQKHPGLRLDIIQTLLPRNYDIEVFLRDQITEGTNEMLNDLLNYRKVHEFGKTLLEQTTLLNKYGWSGDTITNQNRFVGFQIRLKSVSGLQAVINQLGTQFTSVGTFPIYLFHSSKVNPIQTFNVTTSPNGWTWETKDIQLNAFKDDNYQGGVFIIGYYQEDITGNAINMTNFNWDKGYCGSCGDRASYNNWQSIKNNFNVYPVYVPSGSYTKGEMFDLKQVIYTNDQSWGLNLKFSVRCDLTDFFVKNKFAFKNLLALKVTYKILNMMKFSQEINAIEENMKMMIIRDLEGDVDTKLINIPTQYNRELKAVSFDTSGVNSKCLACTDAGYAPRYGAV